MRRDTPPAGKSERFTVQFVVASPERQQQLREYAERTGEQIGVFARRIVFEHLDRVTETK